MPSARLRFLALALSLSLAGCVKHASSSPFASPFTTITGSNVQALTVGANNRLLTSVQVCVPDSTNCQTISNIVVDTGSSGLRLFQSQLSVTLPEQTLGNGDPIGECVAFANAYDWGYVANASVTIANETAASVPVQVVAAASFPGAPFACTNSGLPANDSASTFGANGVLGVGPLPQDCGANCASGTGTTIAYYDCSNTAGTCISAAVPLAQQVQNPVTQFATDNNGVIVSLPDIDANGDSDITGTLTFGIGTEKNNAIATSVPIYTVSTAGLLSAFYNGSSYATSYLASGLPYTGLLDSSLITGVTDCPYGGSEQGYYCPDNTVDASVTLSGTNAASSSSSSSSSSTSTAPTGTGTTTVTVAIANATNLFGTSGDTAFNDLAGAAANSIILGLPFFYGRNVYVAISGASTSAGSGPWYGF